MLMNSRRLIAISILLMILFQAVGCSQMRPHNPVIPAPFSHYRAGEFSWASVRRMLILPLWNESTEPRVAEEIREVLCAELQSMGLFEVVCAPFETPPGCSKGVRVSGRFDELELIELAQTFHADTVLCGSV